MRLLSVITFAVITALLYAAPACPQESIATLLERGYVEDWLVCGPFDPGEPGVAERVQRRLLPLPDGDVLEPVGGVRRVRPEAGLAVETGAGELVWQAQRVDGERIDFSALLGGPREANVFAACTIRAGQTTDLFIDFQSMLGGRLWLNGFPVAIPAPVAPAAAGLQRHVAQLRKGDNLLLMQVPLTPIETIAEGEGITVDAMRDTVMATRPMLANATGFEAAIRLSPSARAGQLVFVPRLTETGRFTGQGATLAQELAVELFNPGPGNVGPIQVSVRFRPGDPWIQKAVRAIPPSTSVQAFVGMPISGYKAGEVNAAEVQIETPDAKGSFPARVTVRASPLRGTAYVVTGMTGPLTAQSQSEDAARRITGLERHLTLMEYEPDYGFYLGGVESWQPYATLRPNAIPLLRDAVVRGRVGANGGFATPDERLVTGEAIARNLLYGQRGGIAAFGHASSTYFDWRARGIAPQSVQLLNQSRFAGRVLDGGSLTNARGPLWLFGLDGGRGTAWSLEPIPNASAPSDLQTRVVEARNKLLDTGIESGIYVAEVAGESAPVYLLNESAALREGVPSIRFETSGADQVFEHMREYGDRNPDAFSEVTQLPAATALGDLIMQRPIKEAYARADALISTAERFAAAASMHGKAYPSATLDWAWRQLLFYSEPNVLGRADSPQSFLDALNGIHAAAAAADRELHASLSSLAREINTATAAPHSSNVNSALVVFNPAFHQRTDVCEWRLPKGAGTAFSIVDAEGASVPYILRNEPAANFAQFIADEVPAFGFRTYYLVTGGGPAAMRPGSPYTIENDYYRITVDPQRGGTIANLELKESGIGLLGGLGNDVLVLDEDPASTQGGRELWVRGIADRASDHTAQVQTVRSEVLEQARIVCPVAGGEITRTITLYRGVPRLECETVFRGVNARDRAFSIQFNAVPQSHTLVTGERYGMAVNAAGADPAVPRTDAGRFQSASYPRAALQWAALSAHDHIRAGANVAVPIKPAIVIHDGDTYSADARLFARRLAARGVSSILNRADDAQTRSDALAQGHAFVITIGGPKENAFTAQVLALLESAAHESALGLIEAGQPYLMGNAVLAEGAPLADVLIVGGASPVQTQNLATEIAKIIGERGVVELAPRAYSGPSPRPLPSRGFAALFAGTNLAAHGDDGSLVLFAAHDGALNAGQTPPINITPIDFTMRYSFVPIEGDWRSASIPAQADAYTQPLRAIRTDLHLGALDTAHSFASISNDAFVVTAFKAAHDTPGFILRGFEAHGNAGASTLFNASRSMLRVWRSSPVEENLDPFSVASQGFQLELEPFSIATYAIDFGVPSPKATGDAESARPIFTRYWRHNEGVAPNATPAASVLLEGDLEDDTITLRVSNGTAASIDGEVQLTPSTGWAVAPENVDVTLEPGASMERRLLVIRPEGSPGGLAATLRTGENEYRDVVLTERKAFELVVEPSGRELVVRVQNRVALPLSGAIEVIVPPDAWPELNAAEAVDPWRIPFDIGPLGEHRAAFVWQGPGTAHWFAVKAFGNGHVAYQAVP